MNRSGIIQASSGIAASLTRYLSERTVDVRLEPSQLLPLQTLVSGVTASSEPCGYSSV